MIHHFARKIGLKFFPSLWKRLVLWRSGRAELRFWAERAVLVQTCPDNSRLARIPEAGKVIDGYQLMHNGIKVLADCYYGKVGTDLIAANKGCHEPQEEVAFDAILKVIPATGVMVELGAYWGFYSLWFYREISNARVYLVEPNPANLILGKRNFEMNQAQGHFTQAYIGGQEGTAQDGTRIISVEFLADQEGLNHIHLLHADIQGFEAVMLTGCVDLLRQRQIDYLFVSTHSMALHQECREYLESLGYRILVSVDLEESYSVDGILVAHSPLVAPPVFAHPSKRTLS